jgi:hypothetical protein
MTNVRTPTPLPAPRRSSPINAPMISDSAAGDACATRRHRPWGLSLRYQKRVVEVVSGVSRPQWQKVPSNLERPQNRRRDIHGVSGLTPGAASTVFGLDPLEHVRDVFALVGRLLEGVIDLFPLDHVDRVALTVEEVGDGIALDEVGEVLKAMDLL